MSTRSPDFTPFWEEVEFVFDPEQPVQDARLFVERDPKYSPLTVIERRLRPQTRYHSKFLLHGTTGNGKTSELIHCAERLARTRMIVRFDLWDHLVRTVNDPAAINRLDPWELVGLIGVAVFRAGQDVFGHPWHKSEIKALETALRSLLGAGSESAPEVNLVALARGLAVVAGGIAGTTLGPLGPALGATLGDTTVQAGARLATALADATTWKWRLGRNGRQHSDQDAEVQALLHAVNRLIMSLHTAYRPLVLILDGIDRVTDPERVRALFVESNLLSRLECDAVVTAPLLPMRGEAHGILGFDCHDLANIPVVGRTDPVQPGPGIAYFQDLVQRRLDAIRASLATSNRPCPVDPFPAPIVAHLAYLSGGIARDFVRLIRLVAIEALDAGADAITDALAEPAIRSERLRREHLMTSDEIAVLHKVMDDPARRLPGAPIALKLLEQKRLVPYPNDSTWYYPHPLLTLCLLRRG